jgi:hypothetical protein
VSGGFLRLWSPRVRDLVVVERKIPQMRVVIPSSSCGSSLGVKGYPHRQSLNGPQLRTVFFE